MYKNFPAKQSTNYEIGRCVLPSDADDSTYDTYK